MRCFLLGIQSQAGSSVTLESRRPFAYVPPAQLKNQEAKSHDEGPPSYESSSSSKDFHCLSANIASIAIYKP
ncbi:hypothetical protein BDN70DRAFT_879407 [Pholiota conissans]|uniref:Uncharacterized protein n=1 Tax=Pholiota conissans TaxID=109636 RepID=A0A9P5Z0J3_9AGAR|nr:hypothetical protein BDN70DRAFT_879407 [Pholiota conissans]